MELSVRVALVLLAAAFLASTSTMVAVSARYLPTRSQEDRLERLRELLKDLFDSEYEHNRGYPLADAPVYPERAAIFKRSAGLPYPSGQHEMVRGLMASRQGSPFSSGDLAAAAGNGMMQLSPAMYDSSYGNHDRKVSK